jgi:hypothetical protein
MFGADPVKEPAPKDRLVSVRDVAGASYSLDHLTTLNRGRE